MLQPFSPHSSANYIALEGGVLSLPGEFVAPTDVEEFVLGVEEGHKRARTGDRVGAVSQLSAAIQLYTGDLSTDDLYDDWIQPRREQLAQLYLDALCDLGRLLVETGEMDRAIEYLRRAFQKDSTSEEVCLNLLECLAQVGRRSEALQCYSICEKALKDLDLEPSDKLHAIQRTLVSPHVTA